MHLSYLYVQSFGVLKNIGLSIDHRFSFNIKDNVLRITRNKSLPEKFWENGIYSLTAIVGNNGCGKTTALMLMKHLLVEGEPRQEDAKVLIVYEQNDELFIYNTVSIKIDIENGITSYPIKTRNSIETLYYSGHFQPYTGADGEMELSGSYEASDAWLLIKDLKDYANVDTLHLSEPLYDHLQAYYAQNHYRICELLALQGLDKLLETVRLPKYIQFTPNMGGWTAIKLDRMGRYENLDIPGEKVTTKTLKEQALERFVYYDIVNLIAEEKGEQKELESLLKDWIQTDKSEGILPAFERCIATHKLSQETQTVLQSLQYVIGELAAIAEYDEVSGTFFINVMKNADKQRRMMEKVMRSPFFLTSKFFDIIYSHTLGTNARLSSGELEFLNLLSRLYHGITIAPQKYGNINSPRLLLLDEAEIGFHPDWQRQYVKVLNEFMGYMQVKAGVDFQIVITSHSPIILSDFPGCCINFLKRQGRETMQVVDEDETFGENVFNLYRRAFFMDKGLIGAFAQKMLNQVIKDIEANRITDDNRKIIALTGDLRIRHYLLRKVASKNVDAEIAYHEAKIQELKAQRGGRIMNKITGDRVGVDGNSRGLDSIRDYLVGEIEKEISMALDNKIQTLNTADQLVAIKIKKHLHTLLTANAYRLNIIAKYFDAKYGGRFYGKPGKKWKSSALGKAILEAFNYSNYRATVLVEVARRLNVKTCPYCNMHYTLYANEQIRLKRKTNVAGITRFQFDHFFDKFHYPMLSMSFYNLIPSCAVCNQGKSAKTLSLEYHPYYSDIHRQFHFELTDPLGPYTAARVNDEVEIQLEPEVGINIAEFEDYRDTFHLKSLYGRHGDVVQEVYDKAYEEPYYLNPANFSFLGDRGSDYLKRLWLGNYTEPEDIEKRPMAKFIQDMWRQAKGEM